ncbi:MAG: hypothetical protein P4M15_00510 [Alphaproteobacteria bacterium]|nr:hypothetical protein [Alphaproteobacteria bacterium]
MDFEPESFAAYRDHLMKMVRSGTENLTEGLCKVNRIKSRDGKGDFIVIEISQSVLRPHRNTNGHYYVRRTEGRTDRMSTVEVEAEILKKEIRLQTLRSSLTPKKNEEPGQSFKDNPFRGDKPIATLIPFGNREKAREIKLIPGAEEFLWLVPKQGGRQWSATELKELIYQNAHLAPFGRWTNSWHERNEFGAVVFQESAVDPGLAFNLSQVFVDGKLLGIDRFMLNAEHLKQFSGSETPYIPSVAFEEDFENGLRNFIDFMARTLGILPPYEFRAGIAGIKGYAMAVKNFGGSAFRGNFLNDEIHCDGVIDNVDIDVHVKLLPFFEHVWLECGLKRPRDFRFKDKTDG